MALRDRLRNATYALLGRPVPTVRAPAVVAARRPDTPARQSVPSTSSTTQDPLAPPPMKGGRQTLPTTYNPLGLTQYSFILRREYQSIDLADLQIGEFDAGELLAVLADLNADVSRGLWNVLRTAGTDLTFKVTTLDDKDDPEGDQMIQAWMSRLGKEAGGFAPMVTQLILTAFMQGAISLDIAPTEDLEDLYDVYPVNPSTIYFQRDANQELVPFQRQALWGALSNAVFRRMNQTLFQYYPIDPYPDEPYGRPPAAAVLQIIFFQMQVLRDLQRVIHTQGWPKIDISIVQEIMERAMPPHIRSDSVKKAQFLTDRMNEVVAAYESMNPEDAYVHADYVVVNSGAASAGRNLFDIQGLLQVIRIQVISALKQLPTIMGEHVGSTETYSTIELTIFSRAIDTFRRPIGKALSQAFVIALQLTGRQCKVAETWSVIEIYDPLTRAKTDAQVAANAVYERDQGFITQDQASMKVTGSKAVGPPPPTPIADPGAPAESTKPANP